MGQSNSIISEESNIKSEMPDKEMLKINHSLSKTFKKDIMTYNDFKDALKREYLNDEMIKLYFFFFLNLVNKNITFQTEIENENMMLHKKWIIAGLPTLLGDLRDNNLSKGGLSFLKGLSTVEEVEILGRKEIVNRISKELTVLLLKGLKGYIRFVLKESSVLEDKSSTSNLDSYIDDMILLIEDLYSNTKLIPINNIDKFLQNNFINWFVLLDSLNSKVFSDPVINESISRSFGEAETIPNIDSPSEILTNSDILFLALSVIPIHREPNSKQYRKELQLLFRTSTNGFSTNRFETHCFMYPGPTLTLFRSLYGKEEEEIILALYSEDPWKRSSTPSSKGNIKLIELFPNRRIFIPKEPVSNNDPGLLLYHPTKGILIGSPPLVKLDKDMHNLSYDINQNYSTKALYIHIPKISLNPYEPLENMDLIEMEVYGLGGKKAKEEQDKEWEFEKQEQMNRTKVSVLSDPHNPENRIVLEMAGLVSDSQSINHLRGTSKEERD